MFAEIMDYVDQRIGRMERKHVQMENTSIARFDQMGTTLGYYRDKIVEAQETKQGVDGFEFQSMKLSFGTTLSRR